jgi:hypothetical protein
MSDHRALPALLFGLFVSGACADTTGDEPDPDPGGDADSDEPDTGDGPEGGVTGGEFHEPFVWRGAHAAYTDQGTTVFWDADRWDVRTDTSYLGAIWGDGDDYGAIHRSNNNPASGSIDGLDVEGGDGSPGIGVLQVSHQGITSARLRNPVRIGDGEPATVEFLATAFQTTGHWFEVALTPAASVTPGELTSVPATDDAFPSDGSGNPGPGHRPASDSINVVTLGWADDPCVYGWKSFMGVTRYVAGAQAETAGTEFDTDPESMNELVWWRFVFHRDRIEVLVDMDGDGTLEPHEEYPIGVPWDEAHVQLLAVAYQADHHPSPEPAECYLGLVRQFGFKNLRAWPVRHARTATFPKDGDPSPWRGFDLRDTAHRGAGQPNSGVYQQYGDYLPDPSRLDVELEAADVADLGAARLVYDIREGGPVTLSVNGHDAGPLPGKASAAAANEENSMWARRSIELDPAWLVAGDNLLELDGAAATELDRLELELGYDR